MNALLAPAALLALLGAFALAPAPAGASGIDADARRLLARSVRASGVDPQRIVFSGVTVAGDEAMLSWDSGKQHGFMRLRRRDDRWWDVQDTLRDGACSCRAQVAAAQPQARLEPAGGIIHPPARASTSGYDVTIRYARNDAAADSTLARLYVRPPTPAEFAPAVAPPPGWGASNAFCFFELEIGGSKPVTFQPGTVLDVWFPFVLDDQLRYDVNYVNGTRASDRIGGTIFDNTLHFVLPGFTLRPGDALMGEIDGDPPR